MTSHEAATLIVAHLRANHVRLAYVRGEGWPTQLAEDGVPTLAEALEPILNDAVKAALIGDVKSDAPVNAFAASLIALCEECSDDGDAGVVRWDTLALAVKQAAR